MTRVAPAVLVLALSLCSCTFHKITVDLYTPPRLQYPPDLRTLMITSRYVPATGPYEDVQWGAYESVDSLKLALVESLVDSLAHRLSAPDGFMVKARHNPRMLRNNTDTLPEPLPWDGMLSLAKKEYVRGILVVEGFDLIEKDEIFDSGDSGFIATRNLTVKVAMRLYEPEKRRMNDEAVYSFSKNFRAVGKTRETALQGLPEAQTARAAAIGQTASDYALMVLPGSLSCERMYYTGRDSLMKVADSAAQAGKWGRAESKWQYLAYNSPDTLVRARASFNMALACERNGRLNQALGYARRAELLHPNREQREYIALLEAKMADYLQQIDNQEIIRYW